MSYVDFRQLHLCLSAIFQFRDLELVRERNRVLSFEIEILTRHLDMLSNGTSKY